MSEKIYYSVNTTKLSSFSYFAHAQEVFKVNQTYS